MSDKYVEINNTDFTGQFESKSNIGNFVTNRQEVVDSYNTGTTLDCYYVLFSNFDIFDSSLTGVPDNIKYAYKGVGKIEGVYPLKQYPYIYTSNFTNIINKINNNTIKKFLKDDGILAKLIMPYYKVDKNFDLNNNKISYSYERIGTLFDLTNDNNFSDINYNNIYKRRLTNYNFNGKLNDYTFTYYTNKIDSETLSENNKFAEFGNELILDENQTIFFSGIFDGIEDSNTIIIPNGKCVFLERDSNYDIGDLYYAWKFKKEETNNLKLRTIDLNDIKDETEVQDNTEFDIAKYDDNTFIIYTDNDIINKDTNIYFFSKLSKDNGYYYLYDSFYNNNVNIHNYFKENHIQNNDNQITLRNGTILIYEEHSNNNDFRNINFGMYQSINISKITNKKNISEITIKKNIYSFAIEYTYNNKKNILFLKNYEIERMLLTNTSFDIIGQSLYIKNIIGEIVKNSYQIRYDSNTSLKIKYMIMYDDNDELRNSYVIYENNGHDHYCKIPIYINITKKSD